MAELSYDFQNEQYIINYLKNEKNMSDEDIAEWMNVYKSLSVEDMSDLIYEIAGKYLFREKPVDMNTFLHDPYFLGAIYGDTMFPIWSQMLDEIYPAPFCKTCNEVILSCGTRCFGKGTEIMMYDGTAKKVEDIVVGDLLMGPDSEPREVLSLARGQEEMYEVIPKSGGNSFVCNASHKLALKYIREQKNWNKHCGDAIDITVKDFLNLPEKERDQLRLYHSGAIEYPKKDLVIDPYIMGTHLGDGFSGRMMLITVDTEIKDAWYQYYLKDVDNQHYKFRCTEFLNKYGTRTYELSIAGYESSKTTFQGKDTKPRNKYRSYLNNIIETYGHKRIPHEYLTSSIEDRLQLLAGIIDTDGTRPNREGVHSYSISTKYSDLAEDYATVARSLGFKATVIKRDKKLGYTTVDGRTRYISYSVYISGEVWKIPCKLKRKQVENTPLRKDHLKIGFDIKNLGVGDYYGFEIDKDHKFLLPDYLVTNNSGKTYCTSVSILYEIYLLLCMTNPAQVLVGNPAETLVFAILSKDNSTAVSQGASLVFKGLSASPYFQEQVPANLPISNVEKKGVAVTDNILIKAGSSLATIIGTNLYAGCLDEANMPTTKIAIEKLVDVRMQIYTEMLDRHRSSFDKAPALSGIIWLTSSPTDEGDVIGARIQQVEDQDIPNVMIRDNIARWEARGTTATETFDFFLGSDTKDPCLLEDVPDLILTEEEQETRVIKVPRTINYLNEFRNDPIHSIQNIAGRRTVAENSFFNSVSIFNDVFFKENHIFRADELKIPLNSTIDVSDYLIDKNYFSHPDRPDCYRYIHLDIASKRDRFGLSSVYSDRIKYTSDEGEEIWKRKYYIDFCLGICPLGKEPVDILKVLEFVYGLKKVGYPIKMVTTDNHQGELARQIIAKRGIKTEYLSVEKTKEPYYTLKNLILTRSLEGFVNPLLTRELHGLRESEKKIEKSKGNTDDLSDSLAGAVFSCFSDSLYRKTDDDVTDLIIKFKQNQQMMSKPNLNPYRDNNKFRLW